MEIMFMQTSLLYVAFGNKCRELILMPKSIIAQTAGIAVCPANTGSLFKGGFS